MIISTVHLQGLDCNVLEITKLNRWNELGYPIGRVYLIPFIES